MLYTPLERHVRTLYVPEDYIDRLADWAHSGRLFPGIGAVRAAVARQKADSLRISILDRASARILCFNTLDVWRLDSQTIQYRVWYRPMRGERLRELWRSTPPPPIIMVMLPVIAALAFIVPEILLMPVFGLATNGAAQRPAVQPLDRQLKAIADNAA